MSTSGIHGCKRQSEAQNSRFHVDLLPLNSCLPKVFVELNTYSTVTVIKVYSIWQISTSLGQMTVSLSYLTYYTVDRMVVFCF